MAYLQDYQIINDDGQIFNMKVSVCVITYNHEKFIEECLISILSQTANFEFEVVIGEDGSKDGTRPIIQQIQIIYPNRLILLPDEGNHGMMPNFIRSLNACNGEYIAICEGDDYWTDPLKLQKQVDFLEQNPEFVACYTDIQHLITSENRFIDVIQDETDTISTLDLFKKNYVTTLTAVFRNHLIEFTEDFKKLSIGDWPLFVLLSQFGKIKRLPFISGVYRVHDSNYFQANTYLEKKTKVTEATEFLYRYLKQESRHLAAEKLLESYYILAKLHLKNDEPAVAREYFGKLRLLKRTRSIFYQTKLLLTFFSFHLKKRLTHEL